MASNFKDQQTLYVASNEDSDTEPLESVAEDQQKQENNINDVSSPGKIFIGGLARSTTSSAFTKHFSEYGELTDSVIMKDRHTGQPRGFGFVTYADPSVIEKVIQDKHVFDGKTVEIKRTIPKGNSTKGAKTKKIFVGGIPTSITEDEFKDYFSKFGKVVEHQIMKDRSSGRSRGFGFITLDSEQDARKIISQGRMLQLGGKQVEIKNAEPKSHSVHVYGTDNRPPFTDAGPFNGFHSTIERRPPYIPGATGGFGGAIGGFGDSYSGFPGAGYGSNPYGLAGDGSSGIHRMINGMPPYIRSAVDGFSDIYSGFGGQVYGNNTTGGGSEGFGGYGSGIVGGYGVGDGSGGTFDSRGGGPYRSGGDYGTERGSNGASSYGGSSNSRYHPYAR